MYKRILVAVDGSDVSRRGLKEALRLAGPTHARLRMINVVDRTMLPAYEPTPVERNSAFIESLKAAGRKALEQAAAAAVKNHLPSDGVQRLTSGASASDVILDEARTWRADVIVMGTHGRRGLSRLLLGSDAERVLRDAPVPVMLVRGTGPKRRSVRPNR